MTNTTYLASVPTSAAAAPAKRAPSLSTMKLAELQGLAGSLGLPGSVIGRAKHERSAGIIGHVDRIGLQHTDRLITLSSGDIRLAQRQVDRDEGQINLVGVLGRFQGGVINMITKSGGNDFHGSFRTTFTNDAWRALK